MVAAEQNVSLAACTHHAFDLYQSAHIAHTPPCPLVPLNLVMSCTTPLSDASHLPCPKRWAPCLARRVGCHLPRVGHLQESERGRDRGTETVPKFRRERQPVQQVVMKKPDKENQVSTVKRSCLWPHRKTSVGAEDTTARPGAHKPRQHVVRRHRELRDRERRPPRNGLATSL